MASLCGSLLVLMMAALFALAIATPLDDYVAMPDPAYQWQWVSKIPGDGYTLHNIFLTSQTWLTPQDSDAYVWTHWLQVCVPDILDLNNHLAFLFIDGGGNKPITKPPTGMQNDLIVPIALATGSVVADLAQIPNEPVIFSGDPNNPRTEDNMIAYTWAHFIQNTSDPYWLARMPMTKAAVRAMDAIQEFAANDQFFPMVIPNITHFVVGGASKRGWTTWTTAAVDPRVVGAVPIVAPVGHLVESLNIMYQAYGGWSFALDPYVNMGIIPYLNEPVFQELLSIVSPMTYVDRLTMPKYVICASGDEFFMPDAPGLFVPELQGEKHLRMVANAEHSMAGHALDVLAGVISFYESIIKNTERPSYTWDIAYDDTGATITVKVPQGAIQPTKVVVFRAHNYQGRDFRLIVCADIKDPSCLNLVPWLPTELHDQGGGVWVAREEAPAPGEGYVAFFIELEFHINGSVVSRVDPMKVTSGVAVLPQKLPYPPCPPAECGGGDGSNPDLHDANNYSVINMHNSASSF